MGFLQLLLESCLTRYGTGCFHGNVLGSASFPIKRQTLSWPQTTFNSGRRGGGAVGDTRSLQMLPNLENEKTESAGWGGWKARASKEIGVTTFPWSPCTTHYEQGRAEAQKQPLDLSTGTQMACWGHHSPARPRRLLGTLSHTCEKMGKK